MTNSERVLWQQPQPAARGSALGMIAIAIVSFCLIALLILPNRELARAEVCQNNLRKLGLGFHNYHSAYNELPAAAGGTSGHVAYPPLALTDQRSSNQGRLSGIAGLLPFIEQPAAWHQLTGRQGLSSDFPPMGPSPSLSPQEYPLWALQIDAFICPSDPAVKVDYGMRSYMLNYGDAIVSVGRLFDSTSEDGLLARSANRGMFVTHEKVKFRDVVDGLSNTAMLSETIIGVGDPSRNEAWIARDVAALDQSPNRALKVIGGKGKAYGSDTKIWPVGKGSRWAEGFYLLNGFTTVMPPGGPSATVPDDPETGVVSASSYHSDGVHVLMADGSLRFVSRSIDTGDLSAPPFRPDDSDRKKLQTPYGVWGAMGTRYGMEVIPSEREAKYQVIHGF